MTETRAPLVPPGVELNGVCRAFGDVVAVADVSLVVTEGSITALLGPSGCGKTTTLRLVAGLESPDTGEILIAGQVVADGDRWVPPEERRVGVVFQHLALFPHLDVAGNVGFGLPRRERGPRVAELLELVGLEGYEKRRPHELSGGQAQRVAVARALAPRPHVMLLDEPFSSLDVSLRGDVRAEVAEILRAAGATTLLVTHDQDEALAMGDEVAVMLDGRIAQVGPPETVYRKPTNPEVAAFLGDANLLDGEVKDGVLYTPVGPLSVEAPDGPSLGLVRPEDLDLEVAPRGDGRVVAVEYFGHDQRITVELDGGTIVRARLHARRRFSVGARVRVRAGGLGPTVFQVSRRRDGPK